MLGWSWRRAGGRNRDRADWGECGSYGGGGSVKCGEQGSGRPGSGAESWTGSDLGTESWTGSGSGKDSRAGLGSGTDAWIWLGSRTESRTGLSWFVGCSSLWQSETQSVDHIQDIAVATTGNMTFTFSQLTDAFIQSVHTFNDLHLTRSFIFTFY